MLRSLHSKELIAAANTETIPKLNFEGKRWRLGCCALLYCSEPRTNSAIEMVLKKRGFSTMKPFENLETLICYRKQIDKLHSERRTDDS